MPKKRYNAEDIIHKLREADVLLSQGMNVSQICKRIGIADQTYYRWRKVYGGMKVDQVDTLAGFPIREIWLPAHTRLAPDARLAGESRPGSPHLATRGSQGAAQATQAKPIMA